MRVEYKRGEVEKRERGGEERLLSKININRYYLLLKQLYQAVNYLSLYTGEGKKKDLSLEKIWPPD